MRKKWAWLVALAIPALVLALGLGKFTMTGKIGNRPVQMELNVEGSKVTGTMVNTNNNRSFRLEGTVDGSGQAKVRVLDADGKKTGVLIGVIKAGKFSGNFKSAANDNEVPFELSGSSGLTTQQSTSPKPPKPNPSPVPKSGSAQDGTNIALGKRTVINVTGGTQCSGCGEFPDEITDGRLDYQAVSSRQKDGVVGFLNNNSGTSIVVEITIDLGTKYRITKIRYNMGNVQRAETWNADSMTSPLSSSNTVPGRPGQGDWTEHTGSIDASSVTITLTKMKRSYETDWMFVGEIEVYGTPLQSQEFDVQLLERALEKVYKTEIGRMLKSTIDSLKSQYQITFYSEDCSSGGEARPFSPRMTTIDGQLAIECLPKILINQNCPINKIAGVIVHEATHIRDIEDAHQKRKAAINFGDIELSGHANSYLFYQQANLINTQSYQGLDERTRRAYEICYRYVYEFKCLESSSQRCVSAREEAKEALKKRHSAYRKFDDNYKIINTYTCTSGF